MDYNNGGREFKDKDKDKLDSSHQQLLSVQPLAHPKNPALAMYRLIKPVKNFIFCNSGSMVSSEVDMRTEDLNLDSAFYDGIDNAEDRLAGQHFTDFGAGINFFQPFWLSNYDAQFGMLMREYYGTADKNDVKTPENCSRDGIGRELKKSKDQETSFDSYAHNTQLHVLWPHDYSVADESNLSEIASPSYSFSSDSSQGSNSPSPSLLQQINGNVLRLTQRSPDVKYNKNNRHSCSVCGKAFSRPSSLKTHMNMHLGSKPYVCPYHTCGKQFNARSNMLRHYKLHFRKNGVRART